MQVFTIIGFLLWVIGIAAASTTTMEIKKRIITNPFERIFWGIGIICIAGIALTILGAIGLSIIAPWLHLAGIEAFTIPF